MGKVSTSYLSASPVSTVAAWYQSRKAILPGRRASACVFHSSCLLTPVAGRGSVVSKEGKGSAHGILPVRKTDRIKQVKGL